ncbi:hypothetical protein RR48_10276 [Papilio machaon]|uniref:Uncharacterized protein n=1 Tax=Papilio machaon TaxID=76193 RepID=A0A194RGG4_PAPMA|nr:hypothetical protein RR48_10276 [Papilio machaon]
MAATDRSTQRGQASVKMDRCFSQGCGSILDAGCTGPIIVRSFGEAYVQQWALRG